MGAAIHPSCLLLFNTVETRSQSCHGQQILQQQPNLYSKRVHRFADDKDVEVASRVARVWDEDGNTDPQLLDLAEVIIRAGMQQFPK